MADVFKFTTNRKCSGGGMQGGNPELSGFPLQTKICFPQLAAGCQPGEIQRRGVGRRNGEINNAATESGVPGFYLHYLHVLHGEVYLFFFVLFRGFCG